MLVDKAADGVENLGVAGRVLGQPLIPMFMGRLPLTAHPIWSKIGAYWRAMPQHI